LIKSFFSKKNVFEFVLFATAVLTSSLLLTWAGILVTPYDHLTIISAIVGPGRKIHHIFLTQLFAAEMVK
jgi:hypothetical protein